MIFLKDYPTITYNVPEPTEEKVDEILQTLLKYEDYSEEILKLRKHQLLKHSKCSLIINSLAELSKLIGTSNPHAETIISYHKEALIELHSPVYIMPELNLEPFHEWDNWTVLELYSKYMGLAIEKGWEDWYFFIDTTLQKELKNYHIVDMLNDLVTHNVICGYELQSFMNLDDENNLLKPFNHDCWDDHVIEVKLNDKLSPEEYLKYLKGVKINDS